MFYLALLIIAIPSFLSLINPWYFSMHDFQHIARLYLLDAGLHQGYLFPRWVDLLGFGFGYPLFNFYPPLIYYISEMFRLIGLPYFWSIKAMIVLGYVVGAFGMYLLGLRVTRSRIAALVSSTLYTFFTYHASLVYVRGAFAEFFGMSILPFAFLCLEFLKDRSTIKKAVLFGITVALLILSHVFVAFPFMLFAAIYYLLSIPWVKNKFSFTLHAALGGLLGLGLSAFYWLPSMLERKFTLVDSILTKELAAYAVHFVQPVQLWFSPWGYGGSGPGLADSMSFQLGKLHIAVAALSFILFLFLSLKKKIDTGYQIRYTIYVIMLFMSVFMMTPYSKFIWDSIPQLAYLQFPWRFMTFTGVFIAVVGGFAVTFISWCFETPGLSKRKGLLTWCVGILIIAGVIFQYHKYFKPQSYVKQTDAQLTSGNEISWNVSRSSFEFSPQGVPLKKSQYDTSIFDIDQNQLPKLSYQVSNNSAQVKQTKNNFNKKSFTINTSKPVRFQLNTFNFPGWKAYIDGASLPITDNNRFKLITVEVPVGVHALNFVYENTPVRRWADSISLASALLAVLLLSIGKLKKTKA